MSVCFTGLAPWGGSTINPNVLNPNEIHEFCNALEDLSAIPVPTTAGPCVGPNLTRVDKKVHFKENIRCFQGLGHTPSPFNAEWAQSWETVSPNTKLLCSGPGNFGGGCNYWCGTTAGTSYSWCPGNVPKNKNNEDYDYRFLCIGGLGTKWSYPNTLFLQGAGRCTYTVPSDRLSTTALKTNEHLMMLIGQGDGVGTYYNITKCPNAFLDPIIRNNYNGIMLDIEAPIYPPTLYELLNIIKKANFKTAIYCDGCGGPISLKTWSDLLALAENNHKDINDLVDYWCPSNYGGTTCRTTTNCPAMKSNKQGNCIFTTVCSNGNVTYPWLKTLGIKNSNILPGVNCGTYDNDKFYRGNTKSPNNKNSYAATANDYTQFGGWVEWIYNVDTSGNPQEFEQNDSPAAYEDNCYDVWNDKADAKCICGS